MGINDIRFADRKRNRGMYREMRGTMAFVDLRKPDVMYINQWHSGGDPVRTITHEEVHHQIRKMAGRKPLLVRDRPLPEGFKALGMRRRSRMMEPSDTLHNDAAFDATWNSCAAGCGRAQRHSHGSHACCGNRSCHAAITMAHMAAGEGGAQRLLVNDVTEKVHL